jgi:aminoglycoside/choline kinase family phosphotransferase
MTIGATNPDAPRIALMREWLLATLGSSDWAFAPASNDASFRRYFRVSGRFSGSFAGASSLIVMDAPPDKEDCRPFVHVASLFAQAGVNVPTVLAADMANGFLLLSDMGNTTYLSALQSGTDPEPLYRDAITALVALQKAGKPGVLPEYDRALLERELMLFPDWYVARQLGRTLDARQQQTLNQAFEAILANNLAQPRVHVHRDYHSRNLMVAAPNPGVLDFQDAVYGPITYDLVSLLRDAYIAWPEAQVIDWCVRYWEAARKAALPVAADFGEFYRDFEWMGAQRQLKVVGIFARLSHRDGKDGYLRDQPLVMAYLKKTCDRYRQLGPLAELLDDLDPEAKQTGFTF